MLDELITEHTPPPNRVGKCAGDVEHHLTEGAVMVAFAMHLLRTVPGLRHVAIHPDGEHGKQFDFCGWLDRRGFAKTSSQGTTPYGGVYQSPDGRSILVNPTSGRMDVIADIGDLKFGGECKGGIINTKHAGQLSRLRKGLCEAVGLLLKDPLIEGQRLFAVVPHVKVTEELARRMAPRARAAGIDIALVDARGNVFDVPVAGAVG
jgi:hypothetical protein